MAMIKTAVREIFTEVSAQHLDNGIGKTSVFPCAESEETEMRVRVLNGYTEDGTKIYNWVSGKTQDDLNDAIVRRYIATGRIWEFMDEQRSTEPKAVIEEKTTFGEYARKWIETKSHQIKPTTLKDYTTMLRSHLLPAFNDKPFAEITPMDFQYFLNARAYLSKKYLTNMKKFFGMICKDAIEDKVVESNPAESRKIYIPSDKVTVREALERWEFEDIASNIHVLKKDDEVLMALLMYTGMRLGEVLGLMWEDIDFENDLIRVKRNVTHPTNQPHIGTTKTSNGLRTIPLIGKLKEILEPQKGSGFILGGDTPYSKMQHRRAWERITKQMELHGATAHIFRHTYLTMLAATGVDVKTIQAIAGHGDIQITMNRYVHPVNENIKKAGLLMGGNMDICAGNCA